jgi:tetratricopeptide (TPR) repeat protein
MEKPFSDKQLQDLFDSIINDIEPDNLLQLLPRFEKYRDLADQAGSWFHRVQAREFIIKISHEFDYNEKALIELFWLIGQRENHPNISEVNNVLVLLERYIEFIPGYPNIIREQILSVADYLDRQFDPLKRDVRFKYWALYKTYIKAGEKELAEQQKQRLLETDLTDFSLVIDHDGECRTCNQSKIVSLYASLGLFDEALKLAEEFLQPDYTPCLTAPRNGLSQLFHYLLESGSVKEATPFLSTLERYLDYPSKARISVALPLIRYYLEVGDLIKAGHLLQSYQLKVANSGDQLIRHEFQELIEKHKIRST